MPAPWRVTEFWHFDTHDRFLHNGKSRQNNSEGIAKPLG